MGRPRFNLVSTATGDGRLERTEAMEAISIESNGRTVRLSKLAYELVVVEGGVQIGFDLELLANRSVTKEQMLSLCLQCAPRREWDSWCEYVEAISNAVGLS